MNLHWPTPAQAPHALLSLQAAADSGVLRRLGLALAHSFWQQDPQTPLAVGVTAAWLAHAEGQGHTALPLRALQSNGASDAPLSPWASLLPLLTELHPHLPTDLAGWQQALLASPWVRQFDAPDAGQPLVLGGTTDNPLLYLRRHALAEARVAQALLRRCTVDADQALALEDVRTAIDRLWGPLPAPDPAPDAQRLACALAARARLTVITGGPGTGKTYTAARVLALLAQLHRGPQPWRAVLAAPTGKAAARLKQSIDQALQPLGEALPPQARRSLEQLGPAQTLHALLGAQAETRRWRHNAQNPLDLDLLIVDEASMVHLEMMDALLAALPDHARLVLLGDKDQLASVEAGAVMAALCQHAASGLYTPDTVQWLQGCTGQRLPPTWIASPPASAPRMAQVGIMLRQSHRFDGPIGALALAVQRGDAPETRRTLSSAPAVLQTVHSPDPQTVAQWALGQVGEGGWLDWVATLRQAPAPEAGPQAHAQWVHRVLWAFDRVRVLCALREGPWGVAGLNHTLSQALRQQAGWAGQGPWPLGRPVLVTRNHPRLGVSNGDVGLVLPDAQGQHLRVWFARGAALHSVAPMRLPDVQTAFALTVHKSQGSEFDHTLLVLPPQKGLVSREWLYTGLTRARQRLTLVETAPGVLEAALAQPASRTSGLMAAWACPQP